MFRWKGFIAHNGLTYLSNNNEEVLEYHRSFIKEMDRIAGIFLPLEINPILSIGDTPACSLASNFGAANEIRPGNFVFYDLMQSIIGSCTPEDIAIALACPVISVYLHRNEILTYGGAIHLSKESVQMNGNSIFGIPVQLTESGWVQFPGENFVKSLSQEHGIIHFDYNVISSIKPGMLIGVLPVHSCLTAHAMRGYLNLNGKKISMME
jgi:D-serine deaminase-like pyridoxal phosphate-dependent protein